MKAGMEDEHYEAVQRLNSTWTHQLRAIACRLKYGTAIIQG